MTVERYLELKSLVAELGHGEEFEWAQNLKLCDNAADFWTQYVWVVLSAGLKNQVAHAIWARVDDAIKTGKPVFDVFKHPGKAAAIELAYRDREGLFQKFLSAPDRLWFLRSLKFIGNVTQYHLARDLGLDYAKPDRHLERIASAFGMSTEAMCQKLADVTGDRVGAIDIVIWRAANLGLI